MEGSEEARHALHVVCSKIEEEDRWLSAQVFEAELCGTTAKVWPLGRSRAMLYKRRSRRDEATMSLCEIKSNLDVREAVIIFTRPADAGAYRIRMHYTAIMRDFRAPDVRFGYAITSYGSRCVHKTMELIVNGECGIKILRNG